MKRTQEPNRNSVNARDRADLKQLLEERRRELIEQVALKMRHVRATPAGSRGGEVNDGFAAMDIHDDLDTILAEMKSETLTKIEMALGLIDQGCYGVCSECGDEIARERLRALPFALRCTACEESREQQEVVRSVRLVRIRGDCTDMVDES